jgi:hypothetical protein
MSPLVFDIIARMLTLCSLGLDFSERPTLDSRMPNGRRCLLENIPQIQHESPANEAAVITKAGLIALFLWDTEYIAHNSIKSISFPLGTAAYIGIARVMG